jgi:hypothetical protein
MIDNLVGLILLSLVCLPALLIAGVLAFLAARTFTGPSQTLKIWLVGLTVFVVVAPLSIMALFGRIGFW